MVSELTGEGKRKEKLTKMNQNDKVRHCREGHVCVYMGGGVCICVCVLNMDTYLQEKMFRAY